MKGSPWMERIGVAVLTLGVSLVPLGTFILFLALREDGDRSVRMGATGFLLIALAAPVVAGIGLLLAALGDARRWKP